LILIHSMHDFGLSWRGCCIWLVGLGFCENFKCVVFVFISWCKTYHKQMYLLSTFSFTVKRTSMLILLLLLLKKTNGLFLHNHKLITDAPPKMR
jgi:hypothetical protein